MKKSVKHMAWKLVRRLLDVINLENEKAATLKMVSELEARVQDLTDTTARLSLDINHLTKIEIPKLIIEIPKLIKEQEQLKKRNYLLQQQNYEITVSALRTKVRDGQKLKVAFFVNWLPMFAAKPLFEAMCKESLFDPYIVIVPDLRFGKEWTEKLFDEAYTGLSSQYGKGRVIKASLQNNESKNLELAFHLICFSTPYDVSGERFNIYHYLGKNVLTFHVNYGFFRSKYDREIIKLPAYNYFWRVFTETNFNQRELIEHQPIGGINSVVTGYCKMDALATIPVQRRANKTLIIAPHHSVEGGFNDKLVISNFLRFHQLFLELPKRYRNINFIFRPHPALFIALEKNKIWTKRRIDKYVNSCKSFPNMVFDQSGSYLDKFVNSDGIIHDCGSFVVEYLFTEKPGCYLLEDKNVIDREFVELGKKCLQHYYTAFKKEDIIRYIEEVILAGKDPKRQSRSNFVKKELKVNFPHASQAIIDYIKRELSEPPK